MIPKEPAKITDKKFRFDSFKNGQVFDGNKKDSLPAMGWNSWNAFGSGNTEALTKAMADKIVELGLDKLGYKYLVLDDGCYKSEREDGKLANEPVKFPSGFKALSDYVHERGLKFGMYNDIGTNLCAGAAVGTCGFEETDAQSYVDWGVDFLKIDNCYYLWDNATFSNPENARYVFAPNIKGIEVKNADGKFSKKISALDGKLTGRGVFVKDDYVTGIGTFDGTNTGTTPVGDVSGELVFELEVPADGEYELVVTYATGRVNGCGEWLQVAVGEDICFDNLLAPTNSSEEFVESNVIKVMLRSGLNKLRLMNHRRQENTLCSYAAMLAGLNKAKPGHDVLLSLCEWGKTQPQNWGYKVGDSWRILNDITFRVGRDGDAGFGAWTDPGTPSVTSQYNKAVVMDEFAGLDKGWNDPDMLMVGMNGMTTQMSQTHFTMWCMMNSPLMLGLDLRRVQKGDELYNIIANRELIALNQDALGVQAKRIFTTAKIMCGGDEVTAPDKDYITDCDRVDVLAKPLSDGSLALSFLNLSQEKKCGEFAVGLELIKKFLGEKLPTDFYNAKSFELVNLWSGEKSCVSADKPSDVVFTVRELEACGNATFKVVAK